MKKWEVYTQHLLHGEVYGGIIEEEHLVIQLCAEPAAFFVEHLFFFESD